MCRDQPEQSFSPLQEFGDMMEWHGNKDNLVKT